MQSLICFLFAFVPLIAAAFGLFPATVVDRPDRSLTAQALYQDMSGREVSFDQSPRKVIVSPALLTTYATIDGTAQHIAAMPRSLQAMVEAGLFHHVFPEMELIPSIGQTTMLDAEWVLFRQPDAVIIERSLSEMLEKTGFAGRVEIDYAQSHDRDARRAMWVRLGAVAGRNVRTHELLERFYRKMEQLRAHLSQIKDKPPRVVVPFPIGGNLWSVASSGYDLNETFESALGLNAARDVRFSGNVDFEEIYNLDPDIIIMHYYEGGIVPQVLYEDPRWQAVRAVRERRVYVMPMNFANNFAVDEPLLLLWLAEVFHPGSLPRMTREAYREAYNQVHHYELSDEEIDRALFFSENKASAGYDRFKAP